MSSRPSSRPSTPWGVSFYHALPFHCLPVLFLFVSYGRLVSHLVPRLVLSCSSRSSYCVPPGGGRPVLSRVAGSSSHRIVFIVLPGRLACSSRFSFHSSYRLDGM